ASGPVSFMKGFDAFAGVIKSGGKTRRAAKMVILNASHPDIMDFIVSKANEEKKAWALIDAGYDGSIDGEAYGSVYYQNANHSVRVSDDFMKAVEADALWTTRAVVNGAPMDSFRARELMAAMADATWICGDPGIQFDTTINSWHTCSNTAPINASNPCSEYMFLDDTACNLSSLNLMKFRSTEGLFEIEDFLHAVHVTSTAMEIIVSNASYPTERIGINSENFRPLGLGYANLGALLMARGLAYDSDEGRAYAAAITALMGGQAYKTSAQIAERIGPFNGYAENREPMLRVIAKHGAHVDRINPQTVPEPLLHAAGQVWDDAYTLGEQFGFRNSQATVLAPTGTIAFMMDCDTTGVEPDIALVKYKKLVGGGTIKIVNQTVPLALETLGYAKDVIDAIVRYIEENDTIEGAPGLKSEHLPVFDCAFKPLTGMRSIHYMGHINMMGAVQPFLSGAISKTVNMPQESTATDIEAAYMAAWREGLKAVAIYRDGSKRIQPLSTSVGATSKKAVEPGKPRRRQLQDERQSITHKFDIAGHVGYLTCGMYEDGTPGEVFITMAKEGSTISGLMDSLATATSLMLQYGVPLSVLVDKFTHMRFEPAGYTKNPQIPIAKSIVDYVFRYLASKFIDVDPSLRDTVAARTLQLPSSSGMGYTPPEIVSADPTTAGQRFLFQNSQDAPSCSECGAIMVRNGACYKCLECGSTSGCS
ncbi:MAG: vitamin B12-dependent ribonucleotide reductase, partial [bacterium]